MDLLPFRFGTVGTPKSTPKKPGGSIGTVQYLSEQGLRALEVGWVRSVRVSEATCELIKENAAEYNLAISIHAPYYINLNANKEEWPKSRKRLMGAAHYGNLAGLQILSSTPDLTLVNLRKRSWIPPSSVCRVA